MRVLMLSLCGIVFGKSVAVTTITDFLKALKMAEGTVVMFYADWCHYSKMLLPEWEELSNRLATDERFQLLQVN